MLDETADGDGLAVFNLDGDLSPLRVEARDGCGAIRSGNIDAGALVERANKGSDFQVDFSIAEYDRQHGDRGAESLVCDTRRTRAAARQNWGFAAGNELRGAARQRDDFRLGL